MSYANIFIQVHMYSDRAEMLWWNVIPFYYMVEVVSPPYTNGSPAHLACRLSMSFTSLYSSNVLSCL